MDDNKNFFQKAYDVLDSVLSFIHNIFKFVLDNGGVFIFATVIIVLAIIARVGSLDIITQDMRGFLFNWYEELYIDGAAALGREVGDYTPSYMYFLYFISLFRFEPDSLEVVHAIKWISIFFDFVSAVFIYLISRKITKNDYISIACAGVFLFIPTIFLNGCFWGQCDSIYVSFIIISIYLLLCDHQRLSFIFLGLAFSFKLQTIFIFPLYILMYLNGKVKFRYFIYVPIVYILMGVPAMICGRSFTSIMSVYLNQTTNSYDQLTLNVSTFYSLIFINFTPHAELTQYGVPLAIMIVGTFMYLIYAFKIKINERLMVTVALFFALLMPYFMPFMHDRYYFLADALVVLYVILNPKKFYVLPLCVLPSFLGYYKYLFVRDFLIDENTTFRFGALMIIVALIILGNEIFTSEREIDKVEESEENLQVENS